MIYDIGSSQPHSLLELIQLIEDECSAKAIYTDTPLLKEEAFYTIADMSNFNIDYGSLDITPFKTGISNFCTWTKRSLLTDT